MARTEIHMFQNCERVDLMFYSVRCSKKSVVTYGVLHSKYIMQHRNNHGEQSWHSAQGISKPFGYRKRNRNSQ